MLTYQSPRLPVVSGSPRTPSHCLADKNSALVWTVLRRKLPFLAGDLERREEVWSAGYVGLVEAAERFDPARGHSFSTYACPYIEGYMLRSLRPDKRAALLPCVSLETPIGDDEKELADVIADPQATVPGADLAARDEAEQLLAMLTDREREVLQARYGAEMDGTETAAMLETSRQRVHQIEQVALVKLRKKGRKLLRDS